MVFKDITNFGLTRIEVCTATEGLVKGLESRAGFVALNSLSNFEKPHPNDKVHTSKRGHSKCFSNTRAAGGCVCELHSGVCYQANVLIS